MARIDADVAKVQGHRRNVDLTDNAVAWILTCPNRSGPVWPYRSNATLVRKQKKLVALAGTPLPDRAGRHAFASYHLAMHENAPRTAEQLGHVDIRLLRDVYRNISTRDGRPITKAMAAEFWGLVPEENPDSQHC